MSKQLQSEQSQDEQALSSASPEQLRAWQLYLESALALLDVLGTEMERDSGLPVRWYDVLIHIEDAPGGVRMNEIAGRILYSKSGLTRVIDGMERVGLVRRVRPEDDRRSIFVLLTEEGRETMERVRRQHRHWIDQHFSRHLDDDDTAALIRALEKLNAHARTLRPGRISS
jgi:DNA-binding MarR family transcriptional regulator